MITTGDPSVGVKVAEPERLNDWAFDRWDDVLVEDDQSVLRVNHQHLTQTMDA